MALCILSVSIRLEWSKAIERLKRLGTNVLAPVNDMPDMAGYEGAIRARIVFFLRRCFSASKTHR
jgi:hypothetical protein